jgi:metal-responsive CopG/Arc/MetJ family transcriptional regulator
VANLSNINITIDDELIEIIEKILKMDKGKRSISELLSDSLYEYIISHYPTFLKNKENRLGPSILPQLCLKKRYLKEPSFRYSKENNIKIESWKKVDD